MEAPVQATTPLTQTQPLMSQGPVSARGVSRGRRRGRGRGRGKHRGRGRPRGRPSKPPVQADMPMGSIDGQEPPVEDMDETEDGDWQDHEPEPEQIAGSKRGLDDVQEDGQGAVESDLKRIRGHDTHVPEQNLARGQQNGVDHQSSQAGETPSRAPELKAVGLPACENCNANEWACEYPTGVTSCNNCRVNQTTCCQPRTGIIRSTPRQAEPPQKTAAPQMAPPASIPRQQEPQPHQKAPPPEPPRASTSRLPDPASSHAPHPKTSTTRDPSRAGTTSSPSPAPGHHRRKSASQKPEKKPEKMPDAKLFLQIMEDAIDKCFKHATNIDLAAKTFKEAKDKLVTDVQTASTTIDERMASISANLKQIQEDFEVIERTKGEMKESMESTSATLERLEGEYQQQSQGAHSAAKNVMQLFQSVVRGFNE